MSANNITVCPQCGEDDLSEYYEVGISQGNFEVDYSATCSKCTFEYLHSLKERVPLVVKVCTRCGSENVDECVRVWVPVNKTLEDCDPKELSETADFDTNGNYYYCNDCTDETSVETINKTETQS